MPDEWKGLSKPQTDGIFNCKNCNKSFKIGAHPDKPDKTTALNEDGSRHQKFKFPPKEIDGKKIWEWTCTTSKADWSQKKEWTGNSKYNQEPELTSTELIQKISELSSVSSEVIGTYIKQGGDTAWFTLAKYAGHKAVCEKVGIKNPISVAMLFKVGENTD